jgi:hypothetical protein
MKRINAAHNFHVISPFAASYLNGCNIPLQYNILLSYNIQQRRQIIKHPEGSSKPDQNLGGLPTPTQPNPQST